MTTNFGLPKSADFCVYNVQSRNCTAKGSSLVNCLIAQLRSRELHPLKIQSKESVKSARIFTKPLGSFLAKIEFNLTIALE